MLLIHTNSCRRISQKWLKKMKLKMNLTPWSCYHDLFLATITVLECDIVRALNRTQHNSTFDKICVICNYHFDEIEWIEWFSPNFLKRPAHFIWWTLISEHKQKLNHTCLPHENQCLVEDQKCCVRQEWTSLVLAEAQMCCVTHKNESHWFSHIKQTCKLINTNQ